MTIQFTPDDIENFCIAPKICLVCGKSLIFCRNLSANDEKFFKCTESVDHYYNISVYPYQYTEKYGFYNFNITNYQSDLGVYMFYIHGSMNHQAIESKTRIILHSKQELEDFLILR